MTRSLGPWIKIYVDCARRKAHYTDRQFRAFIELLFEANAGHGVLAPRKALDARFGVKTVDFLFAEGDLELNDDDDIAVHNWPMYQTDPTAAARQKKKRERDAAVTSRDVTVTDASVSVTSRARARGRSQEEPMNGGDSSRAGAHEDDDVATAVRWLAGHGAWTGSLTIERDLARLVDKKGLAAVIAQFEKLKAEGAEEAAQFVYGAKNRIFPIAGGKAETLTKDERDRLEARKELGWET